jgi:hypothetical protein
MCQKLNQRSIKGTHFNRFRSHQRAGRRKRHPLCSQGRGLHQSDRGRLGAEHDDRHLQEDRRRGRAEGPSDSHVDCRHALLRQRRIHAGQEGSGFARPRLCRGATPFRAGRPPGRGHHLQRERRRPDCPPVHNRPGGRPSPSRTAAASSPSRPCAHGSRRPV